MKHGITRWNYVKSNQVLSGFIREQRNRASGRLPEML